MRTRALEKEFFKSVRGRPEIEQAAIREAISLAKKVHSKKRRDGGEPYVEHPIKVAQYCVRYGYSTDLVVAALLHDVIEDGGVHFREIFDKFGKGIAITVINLTKPKLCGVEWIFADNPKYYKVKNEYKKEMYHERSTAYYNRLLDSGDVDALLVKYFDNKHNMKTIGDVAEDKRIRNSETISRHMGLVVSRLHNKEVLNDFLETITRINPEIDPRKYLMLESAAKSSVIVLPPRRSLGRDMLLKMPPPWEKHISIYGGAMHAFVTNSVEVGLPLRDGIDYISLLKNELHGFNIRKGKSLLPESVAAHEFIIKVMGFRNGGDISIELKGNRVHITGNGINISLRVETLEDASITGEAYRAARERFETLKLKLSEFYRKHIA